MKAFKQKTCWLLSFFLIVFSLIISKINPSILHTFELIFQDAHFKWRGPISPGPEVVIAAIDEKSIDDLGRWPWSRKTMANRVDKLVESEAKIIGFDVVFSSSENFPQKKTNRKSGKQT
jgi:adenylate cyclase